MANSTVNILNLDFDGIKQSFIDWLKTQDVAIKDYNYEGSAFNQMLDTLALNTTYEAFYKQMLANEMFLDSAQLRSSVVSKAKENNYLPRSAKASYIKLRVGVTPREGLSQSVTISKATRFHTMASSGRITYITIDDHYLIWDDTEEAYVGDVLCYAGTLINERYVISKNQDRVYIKSDTVDLSTLTVTVRKSRTQMDIYNRYTYADNIVDVGPRSLVYWVKESDLGTYEISFGDGIVGRKLEMGEVVELEYLVCNEDAEYGNSTFVASQGFFNGYLHVITTSMVTTPYLPSESVESIRKNALGKKISQNRCVTADDYKTVITEKYPQVIDVVAWGGEDHDVPNYGKVFISMILPNIGFIPQNDKIAVKNIVKSYNLRNIRPEFIDPEYFRICINGYVKIDKDYIDKSTTELHANICDIFDKYNRENLGKFRCVFSELAIFEDIKALSRGISTINFTYDLQYDCYIYENVVRVIPYRNQLEKGTFLSNSFFYNNDTEYTYILNDDTLGNVNLYRFEEGKYRKVKTIGTIDYNNGMVYLDAFYGTPTMDGDSVTFTVTTSDARIEGKKNQVLTIDVDSSRLIRIQDY